MLDYRAEIFIQVARCLNISQTARDLYISQPAITSAIQKLEEHYSVKLFWRQPRGLELTPAGVLLYRHLKRLKETTICLENEMMKLQGILHGKLLLGAAPTFGNYVLPPLLGEFKKNNPRICYSLYISNNSKVYAQLQAEKIDLAFLVGTLPGKRLTARKVMEDELVLIVSTAHPWSSHEYIKAEELLDQPLILREKGSSSRKDMEEAFFEMGLSHEDLIIIAEFNSCEAIIKAVEVNLGVALIPRRAVNAELRLNTVSIVRINGVNLNRNVYAATLPGTRLTEATSGLLQVVTNYTIDL